MTTFSGPWPKPMVRGLPQVPKHAIIIPNWANMGVFGPEDTEKVDNGRIDIHSQNNS